MVGKLLDLNCEIWREKCGETSSCWIYDQDMVTSSLYAFVVVCKFMSILFCSLAYKFYRPPAKPGEVSEEDAHGQGHEMVTPSSPMVPQKTSSDPEVYGKAQPSPKSHGRTGFDPNDQGNTLSNLKFYGRTPPSPKDGRKSFSDPTVPGKAMA